MKKLLFNLWAVFFAAVTATASEPTFTPSIYLEPGKSYAFENCDAPTPLNRFLCDDGGISLTNQIDMRCIWTVEGLDSDGGFIIKNAATGSYLFKGDQPWSNSVYLSDEPCGVFYTNNLSSVAPPSSIGLSLSRTYSGASFLCADAYWDSSNFYTSYEGDKGTYWYAYEVQPDEDIIYTQHKA